MSVEDNKAIMRRHNEVINMGNYAVLDELVAHDFVRHDPGGPEVKGLEAYKENVRMQRAAFPDLQIIRNA